MQNEELVWYDDRRTNLGRAPDRSPYSMHGKRVHMPPQDIYAYLDARIHKQDEAKRAAAMLVWKPRLQKSSQCPRTEEMLEPMPG